MLHLGRIGLFMVLAGRGRFRIAHRARNPASRVPLACVSRHQPLGKTTPFFVFHDHVCSVVHFEHALRTDKVFSVVIDGL